MIHYSSNNIAVWIEIAIRTWCTTITNTMWLIHITILGNHYRAKRTHPSFLLLPTSQSTSWKKEKNITIPENPGACSADCVCVCLGVVMMVGDESALILVGVIKDKVCVYMFVCVGGLIYSRCQQNKKGSEVCCFHCCNLGWIGFSYLGCDSWILSSPLISIL